ncbi:MAG: ABC transporter permease [Candidatus Eremiobacteraeota bacterium]|nr:ABC transporter permease [Candidatus Eremiobacteraeota bacterium]
MNVKRLVAGPPGAVLIAFALAAGAMLVAGVSPAVGFAALFTGALGGPDQIAETLVQTTALLFPALGVCLAFRCGLFNIGAEGQLLIGGLFAGIVGAHVAMPAAVAFFVLLFCGLLGGGLWGAIAGVMRAKFGASEIISTLMLNFVALFFASYMVLGPWRSSLATGAETAPLAPSEWLPVLIPGTRLSVALLVAVGFAIAIHWLLSKTVFGYELRAAGDAPEAARRNGVNMARMNVLALVLSGAIAGVGGATIVAGVLHRFNTQLSPGYGYTAIAVALVGDLHPLWICLAALGFGVFEAGGLAMQASAQVPKETIRIIEGLIIVVLAARRYVATQAEKTPA